MNDLAICPKCDSRWVGGQLYWATGKEGCPHDLAEDVDELKEKS